MEQQVFKSSNQLAGALMILLQNSLAEQSDILPPLMELKYFIKDGEIWVENPPVFRVPEDSVIDDQVESTVKNILASFEG